MDAERWRRVEKLYHAARLRSPDDRAAYLAEVCQGDQQLQREVESLLGQDVSKSGLLDRPAWDGSSDLVKPYHRGAESMIGKTVSHYRIVEKLGEGGMGVVYKAEDTELGRPVALKFLAPHLLRDEEGRKRFRREAKAAAVLDHPNVCTIHEIGQADDRSFIVMAFLEGRTLSKKIADGPLKLPEALSIAIQMAEGLEAAHERSIVHRDIKPDNVMLMKGSRGLVKLMDFGLAQLADSSKLTREGTTLGTPVYMSPEQALGESTDKRSDVWALGVVLYEMVAGRPPFQGEVDQAVIYSIANEQHEPLTAVRTGVPKELERIVDKCLAKDANDRYQHVDDVLVDLRELKRSLESGAARTPAGVDGLTRKPWLRWGLAAGLGICALASFWAFSRMRETRITAPIYQETPLTSYAGTEREPTFSPDGSQVAFAWNGPDEDNFDIYVQVVGSANPVRITSDPADDRNPSWSPDGRLIAFVRGLENGMALYVVPPLGGQERRIFDANSATTMTPVGRLVAFQGRPAWFPGAKSLALSVHAGLDEPARIMRVPVDAGTPKVLVPPVRSSSVTGDGETYYDREPAVSPDGERLAWVRTWVGTGRRQTIMIGRLEEERVFEVVEHQGYVARQLAWSPDRKRLIFGTGTRIQGESNSRLLQVRVEGGSPEAIPGVGAGATEPAISDTAHRLAYARVYSDPNLWRVDLVANRGEKSRRKLAPSTRAETVPRISPDGKKVVFVSNRAGENRQIWVCDADGSNPRQITSFADRPAGSPRWSPNGRMIAFDSHVEGEYQTFIVNPDGGQARQVTSGTVNSRPAWSKDGRSLYFYSRRDGGGLAIWKMPVEGGEVVRVTDAPATDPVESHDGQWVYFIRENRLWKVPAVGGSEEIVSERVNLTAEAWSLDQQDNLYWVEHDEGSDQWAVRKLDRRGEVSDVAFMDLPPQGRAGLDVAPDGTWFVYAQDDQSQSDLMLVENFR